MKKVTLQLEMGPNVSRLVIRHEEPLTKPILGTFLIDAGLRLIKKELEFDDHGLEDGPSVSG